MRLRILAYPSLDQANERFHSSAHVRVSSGTSDKFWEISLSGTAHTVRYGRSGTDGQSKTKDFPSADKAKASYEKLIRQKTSKGYAEATDPGESRSEQVRASRAAQAEREPFLRSILENPDDAAGYLVYADWLEEHEDPRAELIRIQWELDDESVKGAARKKLATREKALLKKHEADWLEDLATWPMI